MYQKKFENWHLVNQTIIMFIMFMYRKIKTIANKNKPNKKCQPTT